MGKTSQLFVASQAQWQGTARKLLAGLHPADTWQHLDPVWSTRDIAALQAFADTMPVAGESMAILVLTEVTSLETQHALLKLVEEPPAHLSLVIFAPDRGVLLATLRSRLVLVERIGVSETTWSQDELSSRDIHSAKDRKEMQKLLYRQPLFASKGVQQQLQRSQFSEGSL